MKTMRKTVTVAVTPDIARHRVYDFVLRSGAAGVTDEEIFVGVKQGKTERAERHRRSALVEDGLIVDSGTRRYTSKGRKAIVWMASAAVPRRRTA